MFKKKEDAYAVAKVALKIAVRHALAAKPEIVGAFHVICSFAEEPDLTNAAVEIIDKNQDIFSKDPLLKADVLDIIDLMGLNAPTIDMPKVKALMSTLCGMV